MSAQQQSRFDVRRELARPLARRDLSPREPWPAVRFALLLAATPLVTGCNMILWGNLGVLAVAVGIFLGTVFLSRSSAATRSASRSLSPTSSGAGANSAADSTHG